MMKLYWKSMTQSLLAGIVSLVAAGSALADIPIDRPDPPQPAADPAITPAGDEFSMLIQIVAGVLIVGGILATVVILRRRKA